MPDHCNGLARLDEDKDFCKINCRWDKKAKGRKPLPKSDVLPRKKKGSLRNGVTLCLTIEKDLLDFIRKQALYKSLSEGFAIEPNELIRKALSDAFPMTKQTDMFSK